MSRQAGGVLTIKSSRAVWAGILVVALIVVSFFGGAWSSLFDDPSPTPLEPRTIDLAGSYVALGDSYSAGEGLPPYEAGTEDTKQGGDRCHRSQKFAYPLLMRFTRDRPRQFRACSGAVVDNVFDVVQAHGAEPSRQGLQVGQGIGSGDVALVTISMGGNDLDFASVLGFCAWPPGRDCMDKPYKDEETLDRWIDVHLDSLRTSLASLYARLKTTFPNARILAVGYPALFPEAAPPISKPHNALCNLAFQAWRSPERDAIREWGFKLNGIVEVAATEAGAEYVDVASHFAGHEPCGAAGEWVRFVDIPTQANKDAFFHPLRDGQAMMARIVSCHLEVMEPGTIVPSLNQRYAMTGCVARETTFVAEPPPLENSVGLVDVSQAAD